LVAKEVDNMIYVCVVVVKLLKLWRLTDFFFPFRSPFFWNTRGAFFVCCLGFKSLGFRV
jgi:hypothetical protein